MKAHRVSLSLAAATLLALQTARADDPPATSHGEQLAATCVGCHGQHGEGLAAGGFPRLAGQSADYLAKQLRDFASGSRESAVMVTFAKALSAQDIVDVSTYYAALSAPPATPSGSGGKSSSGSKLANIGDAKLGVQSCANCHGPNGRGEPPTVPYLAGQHAAYVTAQLEAWQKGTRRNDSGEQMATLAKKLSAADVAAIAEHFARQPPPTQPSESHAQPGH